MISVVYMACLDAPLLTRRADASVDSDGNAVKILVDRFVANPYHAGVNPKYSQTALVN